MEIEKAVYLALSGNEALTGLCPVDRIYPDGEIQNVELPTIKHRVIADKSFYTHSGRVSLRNAEFYQVSVYAETMAEVRAIAEAVINALGGLHLVGSPQEGLTGFHTNTAPIPYEADVRACGLALDFSLWYGN
jgi:hypothetical protein